MAPGEDRTPVLSFEDASIAPETTRDGALEGVSLRLLPGELVLIRLEREAHHTPLAEASQGLVPPSRGRVLFMGRDWQSLDPAQAARQRARIGRVFEDRGWVSNLDVVENITLAQRHHSARPVEEILAEAEELARRFGLSGLPPGRPAAASRQDLIRSGWVRAFLGQPSLLILEQPTRHIDPAGAALLLETVQEACSKGAAVLWTSGESHILSNSSLDPVQRLRMAGTRLIAEEGGP